MAEPTNTDLARILNELLQGIEQSVTQIVGDVGNLRASGVASPVIADRITDDIRAGSGPITPLSGITRKRLENLQQRFFQEGQRVVVLGNDDPEIALFMWNAVGSETCPDCIARHGLIKPWAQWERLGLPGQGATVCTFNCRCALLPASNAQKLYGVSSNAALTGKARSPIVARSKEIKKMERERGKDFASSTFASKLGQFRETGASATLTALATPLKR